MKKKWLLESGIMLVMILTISSMHTQAAQSGMTILYSDGSGVVLRISGKGIVARYTLPINSIVPSFSPNQKMATYTKDGKIWLWQDNDKKPVEIMKKAGPLHSEFGTYWSPNSRKILYIFTIDAGKST